MTDTEMLLVLDKILTQVEAIKSSIGNELMNQETIKRLILDYFKITDEDLKSKKRDREENVTPRYFYYLFVRAILRQNFTRIGANIGFDHATCMHGITVIRDLIISGNREVNYDYSALLVLFSGKGYDIGLVKNYVITNK